MEKFPHFDKMVKAEVFQMCADLKDHLQTRNDYTFHCCRIGYKVMDGIAYDVVKTAFAYLEEASKGRLPDEAILRKALALRVPCGRFSYANLGASPKILGVSGTIEALGRYEWTVMQRFGISSYTLVPSVYGRNNFAFLNQACGIPIVISKDQDHAFDIFTQVNKKVHENRAVIVFFRDVRQVNAFTQSTYYSKIANKNVLLPDLPDVHKDWMLAKQPPIVRSRLLQQSLAAVLTFAVSMKNSSRLAGSIFSKPFSQMTRAKRFKFRAVHPDKGRVAPTP